MADLNLPTDRGTCKRRVGQPWPLDQRFWEKVDKRGPDECWLWTATKNGNGYGLIRVNNRYRLAHRVSLYLAGKLALEDQRFVLHRCDNPVCVNPEHLFAGTQADNIRDMMAKGRANFHLKPGRSVWGEETTRAKLTEADIHKIFALRALGLTHKAIAERFPVSRAQIANILNRKAWPHITLR